MLSCAVAGAGRATAMSQTNKTSLQSRDFAQHGHGLAKICRRKLSMDWNEKWMRLPAGQGRQRSDYLYTGTVVCQPVELRGLLEVSDFLGDAVCGWH